jgi:hypothetical protein
MRAELAADGSALGSAQLNVALSFISASAIPERAPPLRELRPIQTDFQGFGHF